MIKTYWDLCLCTLDEQFIDDLAKQYNIDWYDLDISTALDCWEFNSATITNEIIYQLLLEIAYKEVEDEKDREKIIDSIHCNCLDSGYNIDSEDLESEQAKEFIKNF